LKSRSTLSFSLEPGNLEARSIPQKLLEPAGQFTGTDNQSQAKEQKVTETEEWDTWESPRKAVKSKKVKQRSRERFPVKVNAARYRSGDIGKRKARHPW